MKIVHITAECYPVAKVGGLADVVGALPKYLNEIHAQSSVIMPFYDNAFTQKNKFVPLYSSRLSLDKTYDFRVLSLHGNNLGFDIYFIDVPKLLFTNYVYSEDDTERFLAFQIAALQWISQLKPAFDLVHCHDHHTGLVPFMMYYSKAFTALRNIPSVLTIHNAQYQGWFSHEKDHLIPSFDRRHTGLLDWNGVVNPLAAGIKCAWRVTTVSESYLVELQQDANGLEALLVHEHDKSRGILNGIDAEVWNPETDTFLHKNYRQTSVLSGKKANKAWLCEKFALDPSRPLFAFIGRLVGEKGADLLASIFRKALTANNISVLLLGSGNTEIESELNTLSSRFAGNFASFIGYDEKLSHLIYAGADFLLMPSRVEPCGLNQMYSLRYGTIPIVNSVGGLKDTVVDIDAGGFGIRHETLSVDNVSHSIRRAVLLFNNQEQFKKTRKHIMGIDHSWGASAKKYLHLYQSIT